MELWELMAREAIRDLVARYSANGDSGRFAEVYELFAPDATMEIRGEAGDTRRYRGIEQIKTIFTGAREAFRKTAQERYQPAYLHHFVATHQIDLIDPRRATGRCYFFVMRAQGVDHWGRYLDTYEERDGRWLFTYRRVSTDGRHPSA